MCDHQSPWRDDNPDCSVDERTEQQQQQQQQYFIYYLTMNSYRPGCAGRSANRGGPGLISKRRGKYTQ